jgi:hypothetical protein
MTDANTSTGTNNAVVFPLLRDSLVAEHEKEERRFLALLICGQRKDSPLHILRGKTDILRIIQSYSIGDKLQQTICNSGAMVRVDNTCACGNEELIHVKFLNSDLYDNYYDDDKELDRVQGSSLSTFLSTSPWRNKAVRLSFARAMAWEKNPDDDGSSWLSEAQLRQRFRWGIQSDQTNPPFGFYGNCTVLPGDTIYWRWRFDSGYVVHGYPRKATYFEPASDAELQARGYTMDGGLLFLYCKEHRENPEDSDDEDSEMGDSNEEDSELGDSDDEDSEMGDSNDEDSELGDSDEEE